MEEETEAIEKKTKRGSLRGAEENAVIAKKTKVWGVEEVKNEVIEKKTKRGNMRGGGGKMR